MSKTLVQNVQTISNCLKLEQENNPELEVMGSSLIFIDPLIDKTPLRARDVSIMDIHFKMLNMGLACWTILIAGSEANSYAAQIIEDETDAVVFFYDLQKEINEGELYLITIII